MIEAGILLLIIAIGAILWKTGIGSFAADLIGAQIERSEKWLRDEEGFWANLTESLPFRYFDEKTDTVETKDGWLWKGFEMSPIPTDGYSREDWWRTGKALNTLCVDFQDQTRIQIIHKVGDSIETGVETFERLQRAAPDEITSIIARTRKLHLEKEQEEGRIKTHKIYVLIGAQAKTFVQAIPLNGVVKQSPWVDLEKQAFEALNEEVKLSCEHFVRGVRSLGSATRMLTQQEIRNLTFAKLNPDHPLGSAPVRHLPSAEVKDFGDFSGLLGELEAGGLLDRSAEVKYDTGSPVHTYEKTFPISPREELVQTPIRIKSNIFAFNETPLMVISLKNLPTRTFAGLPEILTRSSDVDFPFEAGSSLEISNTHQKIREFESEYGKVMQYLEFFFSASEKEKKVQLESITKVLANGEEKVGKIGFNVSFTASSIRELKRRERIILSVLRTMENLEGYAEWTHPLDQFIATLPCGIESDRRRRVGLTRDFIGISPLTGAPMGVAPTEAIDVFQTNSGDLFYVNPGSKNFNSGTTIMIGAKRSGKSGALNRQRTAFRLEGRRGVTVDFGGSASRVCAALGGTYVDITRARGLGLFSIKPEAGEKFELDELNEHGFPLIKLAEVQKRLEIMCLEHGETELPKRLLSYLRRGAEQTYARIEGRTPRIDDFIRTFENALNENREIGKELAARLEIFREGGSLGHLLNDSEDNLIPVDLPYIVFDFAGAIDDPRLMLIGAMAVDHYTKRLLRTDRSIKKFIDIDEYSVISDDWRLTKMISIIVRTDSKSNCICSISSQDAADFYPATSLTDDPRRSIRSSAEIFWIFTTPKPDMTAEVLGLPKGVEQLLYRLDRSGGESHRDCAYIYPGGIAHLRLRNGALDRRLLLGAGRERATLDDALEEASRVSRGVPPQLARALAMDGLSGALRNRQKEVKKTIDEDLMSVVGV